MFRSYRNVLHGSFEVKAAGGGVVVSVGFELHAGVSEDGGVVSPGRLGQVHLAWTGVESSLSPKKRRREQTQTDENIYLCGASNKKEAHQEVASDPQRSGS